MLIDCYNIIDMVVDIMMKNIFKDLTKTANKRDGSIVIDIISIAIFKD